MMHVDEWGWTKRCFADAAQGFVNLADTVTPDLWNAPGLGVWTVRDLVGHTSRALVTIENYLPVNGPQLEPTLDSAAAYFLAAAGSVNPEGVAERGRAAGQALGEDVPAAVGAVAERVMKLVSNHEPDASVSTPVGVILLQNYLPTRTFELAVHSLDLARATQQPTPDTVAALHTSLALAAQIANRSGHTEEVLLALTGRQTLPTNFSVV